MPAWVQDHPPLRPPLFWEVSRGEPPPHAGSCGLEWRWTQLQEYWELGPGTWREAPVETLGGVEATRLTVCLRQALVPQMPSSSSPSEKGVAALAPPDEEQILKQIAAGPETSCGQGSDCATWRLP